MEIRLTLEPAELAQLVRLVLSAWPNGPVKPEESPAAPSK
jgi:hypothetical protein